MGYSHHYAIIRHGKGFKRDFWDVYFYFSLVFYILGRF